MAGTIPIQSLISVTPAVLSAGFGLNHLSGLIISVGSQLKDREVRAFTSAEAVRDLFGRGTIEEIMAEAYFSGSPTVGMPPAVLYVAGHGGSGGLGSDYMDALASQAPFSGFTSTFTPSLAERQTLAQWVASRNNRYWYVEWDNDDADVEFGTNASFGVWLKAQNISGTTALYDVSGVSAAAALGWMASLDFNATNGRSTLAYRQNGFVTPYVTGLGTANTLLSNGYNFYGTYANGLQNWQFFQNGSVSGPFLWADSYINQIWLNINLQNDLVQLVTSLGNIPFNREGDALITAALLDTLSQAQAFGAIRPGVRLSALQAQQVNGAAGSTSASDTLQTRGWYLVPGASTATPDVRVSRGPIRPILFYTDGQSVQSINMVSTEVQ